ncbi:MAG: GDYXXLXY domain-containing protein [Arthrospira platensis PCC 7345]|uniref:Membrane-anchored protein n=1 Tax=Limnospira platensis NIES-46 TaxID=1236695 RepID=A0A5M3T157_LIMPL|nr:GDYXXLXY domain-containing protein [Arthrospira platensis]MDF2212828.1 GDYXXLXY domain-containing protein [Arthrospira platensis NCB002]MDT9295043.1 GDYXXLXY domain-containing protein [Arthrospira platensis PCC 7345]BAI91125.1 hypothetical protein NIES39_J00730 [Arthrospira platensis NIES-39]BDT13461.1 hypothetical protein N39L_31840 [Arthrospira platensis NIES-39]GCE93383.1 hypothetical protein NIES46_14330 [Arthrospira platensis NIES-46]
MVNTNKIPSAQPSVIVPASVNSRQPRLPLWRFLAPLLCQVALVTSIPAQAFYTYITGTTVVLQTAPVDPYDFLRGYYQILSYEISQPSTLRDLPGSGINLERNYILDGDTVYVILEKPQEQPEGDRPLPWRPVAVSHQRPDNLPENQIAIRGTGDGWGVKYGLETYYMPENQRLEVNENINRAQSPDPESFVVEVKVDSRGNAIPLRLWVSDRSYQF